MNASELADRAVKAKAVLDSPAFQSAFEEVRARLIDGIEKCPVEDVKTAENFRLCLKLLKSVRINLEAALNSGKLEQFRLDELEKRRNNPLRGIFR
jgi:hypothetical protein